MTFCWSARELLLTPAVNNEGRRALARGVLEELRRRELSMVDLFVVVVVALLNVLYGDCVFDVKNLCFFGSTPSVGGWVESVKSTARLENLSTRLSSGLSSALYNSRKGWISRAYYVAVQKMRLYFS